MRKVKLRIKESFEYGRVEFTSQYRFSASGVRLTAAPVSAFIAYGGRSVELDLVP